MILWRRNEIPGHEFARLTGNGLSGVAVFGFEKLACRLDYAITCDASWHTITARVTGFVGDRYIDVSIAGQNGSWMLNGEPSPQVRGCIDVDLNFSPSTNLLPIRRLDLAVGQKADVSAAWLRFPSFTLERLDQSYTRISERKYRYESRTGFVAELTLDEDGMLISYGDIWSPE